MNPVTEQFNLAVMSQSLYDGHCGVALFMAQLANITGLEKYKDIALATIQELKRTLNKEQADRNLSKYIA